MILYMEGTERYLKLKEIKKAASLLADKDFCYQEFWVWDDSILEFISAPICRSGHFSFTVFPVLQLENLCPPLRKAR